MGGLFEESQNGRVLADAARSLRMVFFTGLPASGKSFFLRKQISIAQAAGRRVDILRWDSGLDAFEADDVLAKYPGVADGMNPMIRRAAGLWGRQTISRWLSDNPDPTAHADWRSADYREQVFRICRSHGGPGRECVSVKSDALPYPIPSKALRARQESIRRETFRNPQHPDEAKDAPPSTMDLAWQMTLEKAAELRLVSASQAHADSAYDPAVYKRFFEHLLTHRVSRALDVDTFYAEEGSAHALAGYRSELIATPEDVAKTMASAEASLTTSEASRLVANWYRV